MTQNRAAASRTTGTQSNLSISKLTGTPQTERPPCSRVFYRVEFQETTVEAISRTYANWILGLDIFSDLREMRLRAGINRDWTTDFLLRSRCDLDAKYGCRIQLRNTPEMSAIKFVHPDDEEPLKHWSTLVRLTKLAGNGGTVLVEHALECSLPPRNATPVPNGGSGNTLWQIPFIDGRPAALAELIRSNKVSADTPSLPKRIHEASIRQFMQDVLLSPQRKLPILLISRFDSGEPVENLVDLEALGKSLRRIADVAILHDLRAERALSAALEQAGLDSKRFGCFGGSYHAYMPDFHKPSERLNHWFWNNRQLQGIPARERTDLLTSHVLTWISTRTCPRGFWNTIYDFDRGHREQTREHFRTQKEQVERQTVSLIMAEHRSLFERALLGEISPTEIIELVRTLYSDKFTVCKSAVSSAAALKNIPAGECTDLLQYFMKLSTQAYDLIRRGTPFPAACQQIFGRKIFSEGDTDKTQFGASGAGEQQDFEAPNGKTYRMNAYLKVEFKDTRIKSIRIHFTWDPAENKFIIGHCGEHLEIG